MSHTGPIPAIVTVVPHSTVMWVNDDTDNHSIISSSSGFTSPVIQPGQTYSIVVGLPGKIAYQQTGFGRTYHGGIVVSQPTTHVAIAASTGLVVFGESMAISGTSSIAAGDTVTLFTRAVSGTKTLTKACRKGGKAAPAGPPAGWKQAGAPATVAEGGTFAFDVKPAQGSAYLVQTSDGLTCSNIVAVNVKPVLQIRPARVTTKTGRSITVRGQLLPATAATTLTLSKSIPGSGTWTRAGTATVSPSGLVRFTFVVPQGRIYLRLNTTTRSGRRGFEPAQSSQLVVRGLGTAPATGKTHRSHAGHSKK